MFKDILGLSSVVSMKSLKKYVFYEMRSPFWQNVWSDRVITYSLKSQFCSFWYDDHECSNIFAVAASIKNIRCGSNCGLLL